jgi:hypothetical protein
LASFSVILEIQPELIFLQNPDRFGHGDSDLIQICGLRNAPREMPVMYSAGGHSHTRRKKDSSLLSRQ